MKRNIFLCLFSLELLVVCYSHQQSPLSALPPSPLLFDYLMMAETWPATFCKNASCRPVIPAKFTIHGMWPQKKNTKDQPRKCDDRPFIWDEVRTLKSQLSDDWPNLTKNKPNYPYFPWDYQWIMHGTCSGMSIKEYFELALKAYNNKDLKSILEKANIRPNDQNSIKKTVIVKAIKDDIGFYPQLKCEETLPRKLYLLEIRLCFKFVGASNVVQYEDCHGKYRGCKSDDIYFPINAKESELVTDWQAGVISLALCFFLIGASSRFLRFALFHGVFLSLVCLVVVWMLWYLSV